MARRKFGPGHQERSPMMKKKLCVLMTVLVMANLNVACRKENVEIMSAPAYQVPSLYTRATVSEDEPDPPRKKEELRYLASETDAVGKTISKWPSISLSGDPDEVIEIKEDCFYEDERFFLFFQKGVKIHGDLAGHIDRIMSELEELLHMSYERDPVNSDIDWRFLYFDNAFSDVNRDLGKLNILILKNPHDGRVEWAGENVAVLYEEDVFSPEYDLQAAYHEMAHALQLRQSGPFGRVLAEGIATYAEYKLAVLENRPAWDTAFFIRDERNPYPYDETRIYADPVGTYIYDTEVESGHANREYQYGIRFVTFLVETYGEDVIDRMCRISLQFDYEESRTDMIMRVIKDATSDDVFERFAKWLPEGWKKFGEEYVEYMRQFDPTLQYKTDSKQAPV